MNDKIGALWLKEGKKGKFMSGTIKIGETEYPIVVFKNDKGDNPKRPDYNILKSQQKPNQAQAVNNVFVDDDLDSIPF